VATPPSPLPSRLLLAAIVALGITAIYFGIARPHVSHIPKHISDPMEEMKPSLPPGPELPLLQVPPIPTIEPPPLKDLPLIAPALPPPEVMKFRPIDAKK